MDKPTLLPLGNSVTRGLQIQHSYSIFFMIKPMEIVIQIPVSPV